ncbi:hypothetical protein bAD24_p01450 (plasmid) [Burkholderia sp. AD24]|nr:hypothetical protein bAD24_p01450 [Burkholderia sp. AD24]
MTYHADFSASPSIVILRRLLPVVMAAVGVFAAGCTSKQDASRANFEEAIQAGLAAGPRMCVTLTLSWPDEMYDSDDQRAALTTFTNAGLLSAEPVVMPGMFGRKEPGHRYNLTAEGKKYADRGAFCYGKPRLVKLLSWDPVETEAGIASTKAHFTYEIEGLPDWAKRDDIGAAYPNIKTMVHGQNNLSMMVRLMRDGDRWHTY